jgi:hypothetical protein
MSEGAKMRYCGTKTTTNYKAPTLNLEHIVFEYNKRMKPGNFKTMVESMAEYMTATLKYGEPETSNAMKRAENSVYKELNKPTGDKATRKALILFDRKFNQ